MYIDLSTIELPVRLSLDEAFILAQNIGKQDHTGLIVRLEALFQNTDDSGLRSTLDSLQNKVLHLSPLEFDRLRSEAGERHLLFPLDFLLSDPDL